MPHLSFHLSLSTHSTVDRCKIPTFDSNPGRFPFSSGLSPFAGASSTSGSEGINHYWRPSVQQADVRDVRPSFVQMARLRARCVRREHVRRMCASRHGQSRPAAAGPAHSLLGGLWTSLFHGWMRSSVVLRSRLVPIVSGWARVERAPRAPNFGPLCILLVT